MLRGVIPTDEDGVARFQTIFPGHYLSRTVHIHIITTVGATRLPNNGVILLISVRCVSLLVSPLQLPSVYDY